MACGEQVGGGRRCWKVFPPSTLGAEGMACGSRPKLTHQVETDACQNNQLVKPVAANPCSRWSEQGLSNATVSNSTRPSAWACVRSSRRRRVGLELWSSGCIDVQAELKQACTNPKNFNGMDDQREWSTWTYNITATAGQDNYQPLAGRSWGGCNF